jgi:ABC-type glycerol-3-phosphate transport system permease component
MATKEVSVAPATVVRRRQRNGIPWSRILIYSVLGLICLSSVLAFAWVIMISLKTTTEFLTTSPWALPAKAHFANYTLAWERAQIERYFVNSVTLSFGGASLSVAVSALAAYVISRIAFRSANRRLNDVFGNYFLVGYMIPLMLTIIPLYFMMRNFGLSSGMLPIAMLYISSGVPFNTLVLRGFFESLPGELEEAAAVDGASPFRAFWQIMLPLAWPGLVSTFLINFLSLWNEFFLALIFLRKEEATLPLGLFYMAQRAEYTAQWTDLFAAMLIVTVPVLIVFALLQDQITKGMTAGAIKG